MPLVKRIVAIGVILMVTSVAWLLLRDNLYSRTRNTDERTRSQVSALWGTEQNQKAPGIQCRWKEHVAPDPTAARNEEQTEISEADGAGSRSAPEPQPRETIENQKSVEFDATRIRADIRMDYRRRGLLWYSTYVVNYHAAYDWKNPGHEDGECVITFALPSEKAVYDDFVIENNGSALDDFNSEDGVISQTLTARPGKKNTLVVSYTSRGLDRWTYDPASRPDTSGNSSSRVVRMRNFEFVMNTKFQNIDFPSNTISPSSKKRSGDGWTLVWKTDTLVSGYRIGMEMPSRINAGPVIGRMTGFAPVSLLFFFLVILVLSLIRGINIHPVNYLFLAAAFFSFHILMAYLADHLVLGWSFAVSATISVLLVVTYMRLITGWKFAVVYAGGAQLVYLVLFSFAHMQDGYTGLSITVICVLTLFVIMQLTGRIDWEEKFKDLSMEKNPWVRERAVPDVNREEP